MTVNGKREEVIFYEDLDTRMPVFRTSYEGELFGEYHSLDRLSISLEEEEKIKIILAAIIEGKKYIELDWLHLVGAQTLIWEVLQSHFQSSYTYSFSLPFLDQYRELVAKKESELKQREIYRYHATVGEPLVIDFLPFFSFPYEIKPFNNSVNVFQNDNEFSILFSESGNYQFEIESPYYEEDVRYFSNDSTEIIELVKPKISNDQIEVTVEDAAPKSYSVVLVNSKGIQGFLDKTTYFPSSNVTFSYLLEDGYELLDIQLMKKDGTLISFSNNSFSMPEEDVILSFHAKEKEIYSIFSFLDEGVTAQVPSHAEPNHFVSVSFEVNPKYQLKEIQIITESGMEVPFVDGQFFMPEEPVFFKIFTEILCVEHSIFSSFEEGITLQIPKTVEEGKTVNFSYQLDPFYEIVSMQVFTVSGVEVPITNQSFEMPFEDVIFQVKTSKIKHSLFFLEDPSISFSMKSTYQVGDVVSIFYTLSSDFNISSLQIFQPNGREIPISNSSFVMPDSDVILHYVLEKKPSYTITVLQDDFVRLEMPNFSLPYETVSFSYHLQPGYQLDSLILIDSSLNRVSLDQMFFEMPNSDVIVWASSRKKDPLSETYFVPNTQKNELSFFLSSFFVLLSSFVFIYAKKCK